MRESISIPFIAIKYVKIVYNNPSRLINTYEISSST